MRKLIFFSSLLILISSCNKPMDRVISFENLDQDMADIQSENTNLSQLQLEFIEFLSMHTEIPAVKECVDSLNQASLSYTDVFKELAIVNSRSESLKTQRDKIRNALNDTCLAIQNKIEEQAILRDSLNKLVDPKINIIRSTLWDKFYTAIEIDTYISNKTRSTITYLAFDYLFEKGDSDLLRIPCIVRLPIRDKLQHDFIFDNKANAKYYNAIESLGLPLYKAKYQVKKIVFETGKTLQIDKKFYSDTSLTNQNYDSSSATNGDCPYLDQEASLALKLREAEKQFNTMVLEQHTALAPFFRWYFKN